MVKISWGKVCQENLDIFRACSSGILIFFRDIRFRKGDSGLYGGRGGGVRNTKWNEELLL